MNAVVVAVLVMLVLSLCRLNVILALFIGALAGGLTGGLDLNATLSAFSDGLGGGASTALAYALLGAFAMGIAHTGLPSHLAGALVQKLKGGSRSRWLLLGGILAMAVASQNLLPIHIAFIPLLIPALLPLMGQLKLDRRLVACVITFGLTATYMSLPVGFGSIYLHDILGGNLKANGIELAASQLPLAMLIPVAGMALGLVVAVLVSYRGNRHYEVRETKAVELKPISARTCLVSALAVLAALVAQLWLDSMILGALAGCLVLLAGGVVAWREADSVFLDGMKMMALCGFIMISAAGFAAVVKATGDVDALVSAVVALVGGSKAMAALLMLLVGLLITMGIGSSFSTIPIIAALYVPLGVELGFSALAIASLVGTAGALGDAGSPASDSTVGPTAGLNADGQHDHMNDSVIPTFLHYNLPLILFGWIAAMVL